jgi:acyl-CoA synthetase (AMP-forming)/AMP-acid ligase II
MNTLVFLQFTSGSTGDPKGVMVSHGNLLHNFQMLQQGFGNPDSLCMVTWLPFFHDWGLIGCLLYPLYLERMSCIFFDPSAFLYKPLRWLQAISRYRANVSCAPNFAYELCLQNIEPEDLPDLDLNSWEVAMVGSEPVRSNTLEAFSAYFAPCGFRKSTFYPSYGLAEATLFVTGGPKANPPLYLTLDRTALEKHQVQPATPSTALPTHTLVSAGRLALTQQVIIVNPDTQIPCRPEEIGEIWIAGPSVTQGYWRQTEATAATFLARLDGSSPFLRTGDLGFLWQGELFVTGRSKDIIILAGRNYYPQDIESSVEHSHPSLRPNCGTAFSIEVNGSEHLAIVQELNYGPKPDLAQVIGNIQKAVARGHGIFASAIVIVKPGSVPKTSSGKIKRRGCQQLFLHRQLDILQIWHKQELQELWNRGEVTAR